MRTFTVNESQGTLHIEAPGCIVNIRPGLRDAETGREVTAIEVICDSYPGWHLMDLNEAQSTNIRVAKD